MARQLIVAFALPAAALCALLWSEAAKAPPDGRLMLSLEAGKSRYVCGEPIVLRTTVAATPRADFVSRSRGLSWGKRDDYGIEVALGEDGDFRRLWDHGLMHDIGASAPPLDDAWWTDRHWMPGTVAAGDRYERTDLLVLPKPGRYRLRASIIEGDGIRFDSPPVSVEVVPLAEAEDSIADLGDEAFAVGVGGAVVQAHYAEEISGGGLGSLGPKAFRAVAPVIVTEHRGSAFRETVMYAEIIGRLIGDHLEREAALERIKALGRPFITEYPDSLLLPDVYYALFRCHVRQREPEKAAAIRAEALSKFPRATVLRTVREFDLGKIQRPPRSERTPPSPGP